MKFVVITLSLLILMGCTGYRYQIVENDEEYLLKGEFFNNGPFLVKSVLPNSFLVTKKPNRIATRVDIRSTGLRDEKIIEGYIIDGGDQVDIRLLVFDPRTGVIKTAYENGIRKIKVRRRAENVKAYIKNKEGWIDENLNP